MLPILTINYTIILYLVLIIFKKNSRIKTINKENETLKEKFNSLGLKITDLKNIPSDNIKSNKENSWSNTSNVQEITASSFQSENENKTKKYYYIVKEITKDKLSRETKSIKEFEFVDEKIYISKASARLFYDNKVAAESNIRSSEIYEYELYIVNNVYLEPKHISHNNEEKKGNNIKYLLLDSKGSEQTEGKNFESYVLRDLLIKHNTHPTKDHSLNFLYDNKIPEFNINTKNRFLDGNYKD